MCQQYIFNGLKYYSQFLINGTKGNVLFGISLFENSPRPDCNLCDCCMSILMETINNIFSDLKHYRYDKKMQAISKIGMQSVTQKTEIWCKVCKVDMAHKELSIQMQSIHTM